MASDPGPPRASRRFSWPLAIIVVVVLAIAGGATAFAAHLRGGREKGTTTSNLFPSPPAVPTPGPANTSFQGLTTFRGNDTRSYYGQGPVPHDPVIRWREPSGHPMCSVSFVGTIAKKWCGTGWTGQPNVIVGPSGSVEVREGAYDGAYHFLDGTTGSEVRPPLQTRDLAKGSATSDPEGFPL
jgi:hypothetical protein